jgi:hypothetical protein
MWTCYLCLVMLPSLSPHPFEVVAPGISCLNSLFVLAMFVFCQEKIKKLVCKVVSSFTILFCFWILHMLLLRQLVKDTGVRACVDALSQCHDVPQWQVEYLLRYSQVPSLDDMVFLRFKTCVATEQLSHNSRIIIPGELPLNSRAQTDDTKLFFGVRWVSGSCHRNCPFAFVTECMVSNLFILIIKSYQVCTTCTLAFHSLDVRHMLSRTRTHYFPFRLRYKIKTRPISMAPVNRTVNPLAN